MAYSPREVKVFVSAPDEKTQMITVSIIHDEKTYTTTIAKLNKPSLMKQAIRSMVTSLIRYNLGLKKKDARVVLEENELIGKEIGIVGRPITKPRTPETEAKREYDHRRYLALKALKAVKASA